MVRLSKSSLPKASQTVDINGLCASVCELAAAIFDLPIAFVKLSDGTMAATGMTAAALDRFSFTDRPLDTPLVVADATRDGRFFLDSAVLRAPGIRFYADAPLIHDGQVLGVLGLAESQPRADFDARKLSLLQTYAAQAAALLALARRVQGQSEVISELQARQMRIDLSHAGLGYWKIDLKTREVTWSKGIYAITGLTPESYTPTAATLLDIFVAEDRSALIERLQGAVNSGEDFDVEVRVMQGKAVRPAHMRGGVEYDADGTPARLCAVMRDLGDAKPAAIDVNAAKDAFLAHVTDQLRIPLNDIVGFARLLDTKAQLNPDIATYTHNLLETAQSLQGLIGENTIPLAPSVPVVEPVVTVVEDAGPARDMGAVEDREDDEVVDVTDVIRETVNAFTEQAAVSQTRLTAQFVGFARTQARLDVMRVQQVLRNLIANACKFTSGGAITVTASQVPAENPVTGATDTHLHISVRDTGIGMSEDQAAGLFSGRTRGLGLSISKTIVEMLGGQIGITSKPGEGTNIWFDIPVAWIHAAATVRDPKATPVPSTLKREIFDTQTPPAARRPAYAPRRPSLEDLAARAQPPVDADRINREYLKALLADMKLDL